MVNQLENNCLFDFKRELLLSFNMGALGETTIDNFVFLTQTGC